MINVSRGLRRLCVVLGTVWAGGTGLYMWRFPPPPPPAWSLDPRVEIGPDGIKRIFPADATDSEIAEVMARVAAESSPTLAREHGAVIVPSPPPGFVLDRPKTVSGPSPSRNEVIDLDAALAPKKAQEARETLAQMIRRRYPGAYDDLSDC